MTAKFQWSRNTDEYWHQSASDRVTILAHGSWEQLWEAMGARSGWMFRDQVRREIWSGTCAGWWVGGSWSTRGVTLGAAVGIVNGEAVGGTLGVAVGGTLGDAARGSLGEEVGIDLGSGADVGALVGTTLGAVAGVGTSVGGSSEW